MLSPCSHNCGNRSFENLNELSQSSSLTQGEDKEVADGLRTIHRDFQKMDFHNYVNKEITLVNSNDIMLYALGKDTPSIIS